MFGRPAYSQDEYNGPTAIAVRSSPLASAFARPTSPFAASSTNTTRTSTPATAGRRTTTTSSPATTTAVRIAWSPRLSVVSGYPPKRGSRNARFTDTSTAPSARRVAIARAGGVSVRRTSCSVRPTTNASSAAVPMNVPCDRCAPRIWPHAMAVTRHLTSREGHDLALIVLEALHSVTTVHAIEPENGNDIARREPAIPSAIDAPPKAAAMRPSPSLRRNAYMPRPAIVGRSTMSQRSAVPHGIAVKSVIGKSDIHPDCGSDANGAPSITYGF